MKRTPSCKYHCRECDGHFTSLQAFDAHKPQNGGGCLYPDDSGLVELPGGICRIGNPAHPRSDVTLYEHESAQQARDHFQALHT